MEGSEYRHVAKTDSIKDVVIIEESSIAKGIRRVVAVTGHEAAEVSRKAMEFERRLEKIQQADAKDKEGLLKPYLPVCDSAVWFRGSELMGDYRNWVRAVFP
jgi:hypothetical protein